MLLGFNLLMVLMVNLYLCLELGNLFFFFYVYMFIILIYFLCKMYMILYMNNNYKIKSLFNCR